MKVYVEHGVEHREEEVPEGFVVVDNYHPCSSVLPWDSYGNKHLLEIKAVLTNAGIKAVGLQHHRRKMYPTGSGPKGRVRFGDDMLPGVYLVAVPAADVERARDAIGQHEQAIISWLKGDIPMPDVLRV